jgi:hypothetical protein
MQSAVHAHAAGHPAKGLAWNAPKSFFEAASAASAREVQQAAVPFRQVTVYRKNVADVWAGCERISKEL